MPESTRFLDTRWIARTPEVGVRVNTLAPGQATPWHFHTAVADHVFHLDDGIEVALRDPDEVRPLRPGELVEIPPRRVHRISNRAASPARYLLVQATGPYDFNEVP